MMVDGIEQELYKAKERIAVLEEKNRSDEKALNLARGELEYWKRALYVTLDKLNDRLDASFKGIEGNIISLTSRLRLLEITTLGAIASLIALLVKTWR
jgi:hypothetical protein